jgi:two-component system, LytTR family, response regulator
MTMALGASPMRRAAGRRCNLPHLQPYAMRILIVDDEPHARENLKMLLQEHCTDVMVVGLAGSANEARKAIEETSPDALLLDIKMPGEDGFGLLRSIADKQIPAVFITAYNEFAIQAFKQNAVDYVEKPVDPDDLKRAIGKLRKLIGNTEAAQRHAGAIESLLKDPSSPLSTRLAVPARDGLSLIKHEDILYLEASDSYTTLHLREGKRTVSSKHIRLFETNLDPKKFCRVHKSYIINLEHLKGFSRAEGNMAVLNNGSLIPVSRRRLPEFLALINTF